MNMKRYALIKTHDALALLFFALLITFALPAHAYAYVDPSVMTYTIQALAGVAVAVGAVAGVAFRRTRKALFKLLNIDENRNKIVEPDVYVVSEGSEFNGNAPALSPQNTPLQGGDAHNQNQKKSSWISRFISVFVVVLFCGFTLGIAAPFEMVAGNATSINFGISDIWAPMVAAVLIAALIISALVALLPDKAFKYAFAVLFAGGLCFYLQALFMNSGLPSADGTPVDFWGEHTAMMVVSLIVWLAVIAAAIVGAKLLDFRKFKPALMALGVVLIFIQGVGIVSLLADDDAMNGAGDIAYPYVTENGLFEVSAQSNVIVFILDHFEELDIEDLVESNPEALEGYEDFTWYQDSSGMMLPTLYAIPYLLTAEEPQEDETASNFHNTRYTRASFLSDLAATGYSVGLYTNTFEMSYMTGSQVKSHIADYTMNLTYEVNTSVDAIGTIKMLTRCALYRDLPWVLKEPFRFYTDDLNRCVLNTELAEDGDESHTEYFTDDAAYYEKLCTLGLSYEESDAKGAFRFIHLNGSHTPFNMDENAHYVGDGNSDLVRQELGSLQIVREYIEQLKELGVYDNTTIIITADHGDWVSSMDLPTYGSQPFLFYKAAGATGSEITISTQPVSHANYFATVLEAMGGNTSAYEKSYGELTEDDNQTRVFYHIHSDGSYTRDLLKYEITGDVRDFENWHYTDVIWEVDDF